MSVTPRLLALAGSTRQDSYNKKLVGLAATLASEAGAKVTLIDLKDFPLPLFDHDLETAQGMPGPASALKQLFIENDGLLLASPEYNSSITGVLKNAIDWVSRSAPGEHELRAFRGKVAALLSASPGNLGGIRGLVQLRSILCNIGVFVLPAQVAVPHAHQAFSEDGQLTNASLRAKVEHLARELATVTAKLKAE